MQEKSKHSLTFNPGLVLFVQSGPGVLRLERPLFQMVAFRDVSRANNHTRIA